MGAKQSSPSKEGSVGLEIKDKASAAEFERLFEEKCGAAKAALQHGLAGGASEDECNHARSELFFCSARILNICVKAKTRGLLQ